MTKVTYYKCIVLLSKPINELTVWDYILVNIKV